MALRVTPRNYLAGFIFLYGLLIFTHSFSQQDGSIELTQADLYFKNGNYNAAVSKYKSAIKQLVPTHPSYLKAINQWGLAHYYLSQYSDAIKVYSLAVSKAIIQKKYESDKLYADMLNNLAAAYAENFDISNAEYVYRAAIEAKKYHYGELSSQHAISINNLAELMLSVGRFSEAEKLLKKATYILQLTQEESTNIYAKCLNNYAELQMNMGLYNQALPLFEKAIEKKSKAEVVDVSSLALAWLNAGNCYYYLENYTKAETYITNGLQMLVQNELASSKMYPIGLSNLAEVYVKTKQYESAKKVIEKSLKLYLESGAEQTAEYHVALATYAYVLQLDNKPDKALSIYQKAMDFFESKNLKQSYEYTAIGMKMATLWLHAKQYDKADAMAIQCFLTRKADIADKFLFLTEKEKCAFLTKNRYFIESFKTYCTERITHGDGGVKNKFSAILADYQLHFKGIILSSVYSFKSRIQKTKDTTLLAHYKEWESLKLQAPTLAQQPSKSAEYNLITNRIYTLEKKLLEKLANYPTANTDKPVTWESVKAQLKSNECAVDIVRISKPGLVKYAALWFENQSQSPHFVWLKDSTLETRGIKYYRNSMAYKEVDEYSYYFFWKDIQASLPKNVKKIYLSVDGVYNQLNVNTLQNPETKKYLVEDYDIEQVTNLSDIVQYSKLNYANKPKNYLLIGRPEYSPIKNNSNNNDSNRSLRALSEQGIPFTDLPGTEKEVDAIQLFLQKQTDGNTQVVKRADATEEFLRSHHFEGVVHIATHGYFIPLKNSSYTSEPLLRSGIVLANVDLSKPYDGLLTAYEAANLDMSQTDILVLSACETGLGDVMNGEGVFGLQRAAKIAGAKSVLMSLWTVSDEATYELMATFYKQWLMHFDKRRAMREAQVALMKKYPLPYYWGAFVLVGR